MASRAIRKKGTQEGNDNAQQDVQNVKDPKGLEAAWARVAKLEKELEDAESQIENVKYERRGWEGRDKERREELQTKIKDLDLQAQSLEKSMAQKFEEKNRAAFDKYDAQNTDQEKEIQELKSKLAEAEDSSKQAGDERETAQKYLDAERIKNKEAKKSNTETKKQISDMEQTLKEFEEEVKRVTAERDQFKAAAAAATATERQEKEASNAKSDDSLSEYQQWLREREGRTPGDGYLRHRSMLPVVSDARDLFSEAGDLSDEGPDPKPSDIFKSNFQRPRTPARPETPIEEVKANFQKDMLAGIEKLKKERLESKTQAKIQESKSETSEEQEEDDDDGADPPKPEEEHVGVKGVVPDLDLKNRTFDTIKVNFLLLALYLIVLIALVLFDVKAVLNWLPAMAKSLNTQLNLVKYRSLDPTPIFLSKIFSEPVLDAAGRFLGLPDKIIYG